MSLVDQFKKGMYLQIDGQIFYLLKRTMQTQARQGGLLKLRLRNVFSGNVFVKTIKAGKKLDVISPMTKKMQFLYTENEKVYLMDLESYETVNVGIDVFGKYSRYLTEGSEVLVLEYDSKVIDIKREPIVTLDVVKSPNAVKGDTATGVTKKATTNTGLVVNVPLFVKKGDKITVNTESGEYTGRVGK